MTVSLSLLLNKGTAQKTCNECPVNIMNFQRLLPKLTLFYRYSPELVKVLFIKAISLMTLL